MTRTETLKADPAGVSRAAALLRAGGLVAFPTETVYGLGADATNDRAVAAIYEAKGRPVFNPLIVHVADVEMAARHVIMTPVAKALAAAFWPGPLTLVLPLAGEGKISKLVTAGLDSLAIRVPAHETAQALLRATGRPVAAPSANPSGRISPTSAAHVLDGLDGRIGAVLDGGECAVGLESTILDARGPVILLRPGGVATESIEAVVGPVGPAAAQDVNAPTAPGQLASHYAPSAPVRLRATSVREDEVLLGFGGTPGATCDLSPTGDLIEAAANLFSMLHALDASGKPIAVAPVPDEGLGRAINDRLTRAAAPRMGQPEWPPESGPSGSG